MLTVNTITVNAVNCEGCKYVSVQEHVQSWCMHISKHLRQLWEWRHSFVHFIKLHLIASVNEFLAQALHH